MDLRFPPTSYPICPNSTLFRGRRLDSFNFFQRNQPHVTRLCMGFWEQNPSLLWLNSQHSSILETSSEVKAPSNWTYNPGKKGWDSLSDLVQRGSPLSPNAMLIRVMLPEAAAGHPTLIDGVGKDMTNGELGGFFKTMHCPKCPYNREHWDNCNKVDQVSQLFFPGLSERNPKFFI